MVKGLESQTIEIAIGTLKRKRGVVNITPSICIGIGMKAQKRPISTPLLTDFLFMLKYSLGRLYFSINLSSFEPEDFFLNAFRIICIRDSIFAVYSVIPEPFKSPFYQLLCRIQAIKYA